MNAWLKRRAFNLYLNRESVSEPQTLSGRLFQSLGAKYENRDIKKIFQCCFGVFAYTMKVSGAKTTLHGQCYFFCSTEERKS